MDFISQFKKEYIPLNTIEVSKAALLHNYSYLSKAGDLKIAPTLKSDAYGHGIVLVAKTLDVVGAPFFCVDSLYEAYELLKANIKTPILVMGYVHPKNLAVKKLPFSYAISSVAMLEAILKYQPHAGIHVFVDTGIRREGIPMEDLSTVIELLQSKENVNIEGLMAHFAASDNFNTMTQLQVKNFQKAQALFTSGGFSPKWIHHANSSGVLNYKNYKGKIGNMARVGVSTYGVDPENKDTKLKPALRFTATLSQIKNLSKDESSGYDFTFKAKKNMKIGVVSAGYNDGVDRRLSNIGFMKIGKTFCKIVGRVSMNITMIDVSAVKDVKIGDKVVIFSDNRKDKNSVSAAALLCKTIAYEFLVKLHTSTKRILV